MPGMKLHTLRRMLVVAVITADTKAKAEQIVKAVRGMESVDNKIVVTG